MEKKKKNMWKIIAITLIVCNVLGFAFQGLGQLLSKAQSVPENYAEKINTTASLEAKYLQKGQYEVEFIDYPAMMSFQKYNIYYPKNIKNMEKVPAVIFMNGTGVKGSKYLELQKHLATWGFITVSTEAEHSWDGFSGEMSVRFLNNLNTYQEEGKENQFFGKIDMENIGITGHSQGGIGVINAITDQRNAKVYKAAVILSSTENEIAQALQWETHSNLITASTLMITSNGQTDKAIASPQNLEKMFNNIAPEIDKVKAVRNGVDHGEMLYYADGYVTAWFMTYLQGDKEAEKAFEQNGELSLVSNQHSGANILSTPSSNLPNTPRLRSSSLISLDLSSVSKKSFFNCSCIEERQKILLFSKFKYKLL